MNQVSQVDGSVTVVTLGTASVPDHLATTSAVLDTSVHTEPGHGRAALLRRAVVFSVFVVAAWILTALSGAAASAHADVPGFVGGAPDFPSGAPHPSPLALSGSLAPVPARIAPTPAVPAAVPSTGGTSGVVGAVHLVTDSATDSVTGVLTGVPDEVSHALRSPLPAGLGALPRPVGPAGAPTGDTPSGQAHQRTAPDLPTALAPAGAGSPRVTGPSGPGRARTAPRLTSASGPGHAPLAPPVPSLGSGPEAPASGDSGHCRCGVAGLPAISPPGPAQAGRQDPSPGARVAAGRLAGEPPVSPD